MNRSYQARYHDGSSGQPFTVDVSFTEKGISIQYTDPSGRFVQNEWSRELIRQVEYRSSIISLAYGTGNPQPLLEITDRDFHREYTEKFRVPVSRRWGLRGGRGILAGIFGSIVLLLLLSYLFLLPFIADKAAQQIPKEYEISLGKQLYANTLQGETIDSARTAAANAFFRQIHVEGDYPVEITVVKSNISNAFALPGGGIVVYDKILEGMKNETELAALLSHEYSHVQLRHATRNIFRNLSGYLFLYLLVGDMNSVSSVVIRNAENLRTLSYTRDLEQEADDNGLHIMQANQIDAAGMKELFEQLKKESGQNIEILSTHPDLDNRIRNVELFEEKNPYQTVKNDSLAFYFNLLKK